MSNTKGSLLISNANAVGTALITKLGGTGYKPSEWGDAVNLLGISSSDISTALANITTGSYTGSERGSIKISNLNLVGSMLNKKFNTDRGFKPNEWESAISKLTALEIKTASGAIASFSDGADGVPVKNWLVTLPASLSGYSEVNAVRSGKNLFDKDNANVVNGYIDVSAFNTGNANAKTIYIPIKGGVTYTVSKTVGARFSIATSDVIPTSGATYTSRQAGNTASSLTITAGANDTYLWAWVYLNGTDTGTLDDMLASVQIEVGSTATAYSAYEATTQYTASLGRTVYGGTADIVTGEGEDGARKETMTSTYLNGLAEGYIGYSTNVSAFGGHSAIWVRNFGYPYANQIVSGGIGCVCNHFPVTMNNQSVVSSQYRIYFDVDGTGITTAQGFIDYVEELEANNDSLDIAYDVSTQTPFTFTPITAETELGTNNFWADEGDSEVTYRADIDLALNA